MKEIFENAYNGACEGIKDTVELFAMFSKFVLITLIYITTPLWFIPFAIYKKVKGGAE